MDADLGNAHPDQAFDIPPKEARSFSWRITVPDGLGPITYKAVGAADKLSATARRAACRSCRSGSSSPSRCRCRSAGRQTKTFEFAKLLESGKSDTLRHQALTVQMTSQPGVVRGAWRCRT